LKTIFKLSLLALFLSAFTSHALTVTNIATGCEAEHSLFLTSDGSLWAMGFNNFGQLGDGQAGNGTYNQTNSPEQIVSSDVTAIAAGLYYSLFLKSDGSLWGMGLTSNGQLGDGTFYRTNQPEQIVSSGVTAIAAGQSHSLFLKSDGSLWAMGYNFYGQLGDGTFNRTNKPEQIVTNGVTAIAAGWNHSLFLKSDGSLWAMGNNDFGQLGDFTHTQTNRPKQIVSSGVTAIAAGGAHNLFIKSNGSLWAMGNNDSGQLGDGSEGSFNHIDWPKQIVASGVTAIAAGGQYSLFTKSDGNLWGMGLNSHGELGDGFTNNSVIPEQIFPLPRPKLSSVLLSKTNLQFKATCGYGGNFYLLGSTNIDSPLNLWTPLRTNSVTARGTNNFSYTLTNAINSGAQRFYILQSQ
jgi:alpha-tubulin suppressor-like RCC1 family protein